MHAHNPPGRQRTQRGKAAEQEWKWERMSERRRKTGRCTNRDG